MGHGHVSDKGHWHFLNSTCDMGTPHLGPPNWERLSGRPCLSVCLSVYLSVFLSIRHLLSNIFDFNKLYKFYLRMYMVLYLGCLILFVA